MVTSQISVGPDIVTKTRERISEDSKIRRKIPPPSPYHTIVGIMVSGILVVDDWQQNKALDPPLQRVKNAHKIEIVLNNIIIVVGDCQ